MNQPINPILLDFPLPITTPRLLLRSPKLGDELEVNAAILESYDELQHTMPWAKQKPTIAETEMYVRDAAANWILKKNDEPYLPLFIYDKSNQQFIGSTGYHHYDWAEGSIEIGYWIRKKFSGKGLMTEAINALTQYAFKQLKMKRITITCDINTIRSKKIPEKLHYELAKIIKSNRINEKGEISDTLVYVKFDLNNLPELFVTW